MQRKWVIISIPDGVPLGGHVGMAHDNTAVARNAEVEFVGRSRPFVDAQVAMGTVSDSGGISASFLAFCCQHRENIGLFSGTEPPVTVDHSK